MNQFNKEILDALSSDSKKSLKDVFRNQLEQTVNTLLLGITHVEAIASGMFVVAPKTGGQVEFLKMFPGRYCLVDQDNENSVMRGIKKGLKSNLLPLGNDDLQLLSFENTYLSIIKTLKSKDALC